LVVERKRSNLPYWHCREVEWLSLRGASTSRLSQVKFATR
jgi:hypothetical protein